MKNWTSLLIPAILIFSLLASAYSVTGDAAPPKKSFYPNKVNTVIQEKCFGCHNPEAKGEKPKKLLNFVEFPTLEKAVKAEKAQNLLAILEKGTMPPKFITDRNPEKKLTDKETAILKKWAKKIEKKALK
jgi:uncharacterized membrane protein